MEQITLNDRRDNDIRLTNRRFGFVFTLVFTAIGFAPLLRHHELRLWALVVAFCLCVTAFVKPWILEPANRLWARATNVIQSAIAMAALFLCYVIGVLMVALVLRLLKKDLLHRRFEPSNVSYWIVRTDRNRGGAGMENQF
jgi:hypothetical protein